MKKTRRLTPAYLRAQFMEDFVAAPADQRLWIIDWLKAAHEAEVARVKRTAPLLEQPVTVQQG